MVHLRQISAGGEDHDSLHFQLHMVPSALTLPKHCSRILGVFLFSTSSASGRRNETRGFLPPHLESLFTRRHRQHAMRLLMFLPKRKGEQQIVGLPSLESFVEKGWISEVLGALKSGKEATAYCCQADPSSGYTLLLAKVYRSLEFRSFRNDAAYREGFYIADSRLRRASRNKTRVGRAVDFGTWVENEYRTLGVLHAAGADVPMPLDMSGNAILMEYIGDEDGPAPQLNKVTLKVDEARTLYQHLIGNIRLWLTHHVVHGDLSGFNILYWQGGIKVIDFPQAVDPRSNSHAYAFLQRDIENVCRYFGRYGVDSDPWRIADDLWARYMYGCLSVW
jgi:RIO kinase 1